jgi:hypothetical protein
MYEKLTYFGVDETGMGNNSNSVLVAVAMSSNPALTKDEGFGCRLKAGEILHRMGDGENIQFPSLGEMKAEGLDGYSWVRARGGRFSSKLVEHAAVAHAVSLQCTNPRQSVLLIDTFHGNRAMSKYLLYKLLDYYDCSVPLEQIELIDDGDRRVPLINFADIIAFQVGAALHRQHYQYMKHRRQPVAIDTRFVGERLPPVDESSRDHLEHLVSQWKSVLS